MSRRATIQRALEVEVNAPETAAQQIAEAEELNRQWQGLGPFPAHDIPFDLYRPVEMLACSSAFGSAYSNVWKNAIAGHLLREPCRQELLPAMNASEELFVDALRNLPTMPGDALAMAWAALEALRVPFAQGELRGIERPAAEALEAFGSAIGKVEAAALLAASLAIAVASRIHFLTHHDIECPQDVAKRTSLLGPMLAGAERANESGALLKLLASGRERMEVAVSLHRARLARILSGAEGAKVKRARRQVEYLEKFKKAKNANPDWDYAEVNKRLCTGGNTDRRKKKPGLSDLVLATAKNTGDCQLSFKCTAKTGKTYLRALIELKELAEETRDSDGI